MNTWTWSWAIRNFVAELLIPPGIWIFIALLAMLLLNRKKIWQKTIVISCLVLLWITSTTAFANWFVQITDQVMNWPKPIAISQIVNFSNENSGSSTIRGDQHAKANASQEKPQAIVILGGGKRRGALELPEYGFSDVSKETMERLRVGAKLAKQNGLPVLLTGGAPDATSANDLSEAAVMAAVLKDELGVKAKWLEEQSNTSLENAKLSAELLKKVGISSVYLVTHFWHMPRAQRAFEKQGIKVIPVAHAYQDLESENNFNFNKLTPVDYFPSSSGITRVRQIWHELIGQVWYLMIG